MEGKKTTSYFSLFENLSLLLYRTVLRQKVNTGQKLSTPVPQHQKQKSKHCIGTFFLYYLTAT